MQLLVRCAVDKVKAVAVGSTPSQDRAKDRPSVLPRKHSCRLMSACLDFVCTVRVMIVMHVRVSMPTVRFIVIIIIINPLTTRVVRAERP